MLKSRLEDGVPVRRASLASADPPSDWLSRDQSNTDLIRTHQALEDLTGWEAQERSRYSLTIDYYQ
jgi:hypothetical protein